MSGLNVGDFQYIGSDRLTSFQVHQGSIGIFERVECRCGPDRDFRGERQEGRQVFASDVRHGLDFAFHPQVLVVVDFEKGFLVVVFFADRIYDEATARRQSLEGSDDGGPSRSRVDNGVEWAWRRFLNVACPLDAAISRELLGALSASEREDFAFGKQVARQLNDEMRRSAEPH